MATIQHTVLSKFTFELGLTVQRASNVSAPDGHGLFLRGKPDGFA